MAGHCVNPAQLMNKINVLQYCIVPISGIALLYSTYVL